MFTFNILILKTDNMRGHRLLGMLQGDWDASFQFPADSGGFFILLGLYFQRWVLFFSPR